MYKNWYANIHAEKHTKEYTLKITNWAVVTIFFKPFP